MSNTIGHLPAVRKMQTIYFEWKRGSVLDDADFGF